MQQRTSDYIIWCSIRKTTGQYNLMQDKNTNASEGRVAPLTRSQGVTEKKRKKNANAANQALKNTQQWATANWIDIPKSGR